MNIPKIIDLLPLLNKAQKIGTLPSYIKRVHTDTRSLSEGDLFIALKGGSFDAHNFLAQAKNQGAIAAVAQYGLSEANLPGVCVPDTRKALGELASLWRSHYDLPIIAVTGSNGKTTVTQMIASILRSYVGENSVLATYGNLNNDIGVPLTLLRLNSSHKIAVIELGMNHPNEISVLAEISRPTVALINNAQREHQEFMVSVEAVAKENGTVVSSLTKEGVVVIPSDDEYSAYWRLLADSRRVISFSDTDVNADIHLIHKRTSTKGLTIRTPQGEIAVQLQTVGKHNIRNALAATACAFAVGVSNSAVSEGLSSFMPVQGRSKLLHLRVAGHDLDIVDDTYNANPDSVRAAIDTLSGMDSPQVLVLGDMGEVGEQSLEFHTEVIDYACHKNINTILCIGEEMAKAVSCMRSNLSAVTVAADLNDLNALVRDVTNHGGSLLVKGSRFMRMERIIEALISSKG